MEDGVKPLEEWNFGDTSEVSNWQPNRHELPDNWTSVVPRISDDHAPEAPTSRDRNPV